MIILLVHVQRNKKIDREQTTDSDTLYDTIAKTLLNKIARELFAMCAIQTTLNVRHRWNVRSAVFAPTSAVTQEHVLEHVQPRVKTTREYTTEDRMDVSVTSLCPTGSACSHACLPLLHQHHLKHHIRTHQDQSFCRCCWHTVQSC